MTGIVFDIRRYSIHDGPGIRTAVFLKGCPLRCVWCHNPEGQDTGVSRYRRKNLVNALQEEDVLVGKEMAVAEVMNELLKDVVFYENSGGGVTFSGGEPLMQPVFLSEMLAACKACHLHTAIDTCGYAPGEFLEQLIPYTDLFLFDLKQMNDGKHLQYTGVSNSIILDNLRLLDKSGSSVVLRIPVIPGMNDEAEHFRSICEMLIELKNIREIYLLPYHSLAGNKYRRFGIEYSSPGIAEPSKERMLEIKVIFESYGFEVNYT